MDVSGTLHFYSGDDKEFFFVFDDDVAQEMYESADFDVDDLESRRVYISVGTDRFIHRRTLSFSRKQTEIKVSLCSRATKDGLQALTALYDWFARLGSPHPAPFCILGTLDRARFEGAEVWELRLTEPEDLVSPPGLTRRRKAKSHERRSFEHRRDIQRRDLSDLGRPAEQLALDLVQADFCAPDYSCLWRNTFLDSERIEVRKMGIVADIDVWNVTDNVAEKFVEVKAQKIVGKKATPAFYLSLGEWRSFKRAKHEGLAYEVWLFQYRHQRDFANSPEDITLIIFDDVLEEWLDPNGYLVTPAPNTGKRYDIEG